jgi:hypothetical protein
MTSESIARLRQEQNAFEELLPELLEEHRGEYAVFCECKPVGFYQSREIAYRAGLKRWGLDGVFLVSEVTETESDAVSVVWEFGLMSG